MVQEETLEALNQQMLAASQKGNGRQIADTSKKIHTCQSTIDDLYADLESITSEHDSQEDAFEAQLNALQEQLDRSTN